MVLVIFNKSCVLLNEAQLDFQEGPGRAPKRVFGALARSKGHSGRVRTSMGAVWEGTWIGKSVPGLNI